MIELDAKARATQKEADELRASRNTLSKQIGQLMGQGKKEEAEAVKAQVSANAARLAELEETEKSCRKSNKDHDGNPKHHRSVCSNRKR